MDMLKYCIVGKYSNVTTEIKVYCNYSILFIVLVRDYIDILCLTSVLYLYVHTS